MDDGAGLDASRASSQAQLLHVQSFCPDNVQHNAKQFYYIRSVFTSVAGSAAGVLGLTNLWGFYFYIISLIAVNIFILLINTKRRPDIYLVTFNPPPSLTTESGKGQGKAEKEVIQSQNQGSFTWASAATRFLVEGLQEMAFGYVLWWTLWTGLIHVYD